MKLIYINELGKDFREQHQYEFIFSNSLVDKLEVENPYIVDFIREEWFHVPSSDRSTPPNIDDIDMVGLLKNSDLKLDLVQSSDYFGVVDAVEGIIALGWEPFDEEADEWAYKRLSFHFGEDVDSVTEKLATRAYRLIKEELKYKIK